MHILLDECLPRQLARESDDHVVVTVQKAGWSGLRNGKLLKNMSGHFEVFLTIDKRIQHEQKIPPDVAIVTIRARSNRIQDLRPLVPQLRRAIEESKPGKSTGVGRIARR